MQSMRDIRQRISSVRNIQHITRAMKMVSVAKLHKAEVVDNRAKRYRKCADEIFEFIVSKMPRLKHPFFTERGGKGVVAIAVASDKGLCGGYNNELIKKVKDLKHKTAGDAVRIVAVGKKCVTLCRQMGWKVVAGYTTVHSKGDATLAETLTKRAIRMYEEEDVSKIVMVYNPYKAKTMGTSPICNILPIERKETEDRPEQENYLFDPLMGEVIDRLLNIVIMSRILKILMEARISEHLARMQAMDNASKNAADLIDELTLSYNKARQSSITSELIDIIGGAQLIV